MMKLVRKFSTLVVPDPNKAKELPLLLAAGKKFGEPVRVLQMGQSGIEAEVKKIEVEAEVDLVEDESFDGKQYEKSSQFLSNYFAKNKFNRVITTNSFISKEILPRVSV